MLSHLERWQFWNCSPEPEAEGSPFAECPQPVVLVHVLSLLVEDGGDVFHFGYPRDLGCGGRHDVGDSRSSYSFHIVGSLVVVRGRTVFLVIV